MIIYQILFIICFLFLKYDIKNIIYDDKLKFKIIFVKRILSE